MPWRQRPFGSRRWPVSVVIALALPVLGAAIAFGISRGYSGEMQRRTEEIAALEEFHHAVADLERQVLAGERAVRAFRLTGEVAGRHVAAYAAMRREVPEHKAHVRALAEDFPGLRAQIAPLERLVEGRLRTLEALRAGGAPGSMQERVAAQSGWLAAERLDAALVGAHDAIDRELEPRRERHTQLARAANRVWLLIPVGLLGTAAVAFSLLRRSAHRIALLKRNTANLVGGRALEPFPYDGGGLDELAVAVDQAGELLESRERDRVAAHEEAQRANQAKTAFLSRMSHELRTPLTAVLGFAELLDMDDLTEGQHDSVRQIRKAGAHLLALINEVLDISRIESGNLQMSIEPMELGSVVGDALTLIRPIAEERGVKLSRRCGDGVYIRADRQRVTQVLLNLLSNAVKYNREFGEVRLECEARGDTVRLSVTDTGLGIAPELLPRLFAAFDRLGAERRGIEGTGVGLMLSKGLVEAMGGTLTVESVPGQGSTFTVTLPVDTAPGAGEDAPADVEAAAPAAGRAVRVLYVEDNQANIDLVERFLARRPGVQLITTVQGRMALDLARVHRPDLVLLDLHLPDLDGESVLRELRGHVETADLRVAMLTADATSSQEARLLALGADDYVTKPLDFMRLTSLLESVEGTARQAEVGA